MANTNKPVFYSGQNVYRDNLQNIVEYDSEARAFIIKKLYHDGVINATPYDLNALKVVTDSYRNNAGFTDFNSSLTANNPIKLSYSVDNPPSSRVLYAQKFQARSNNIQKIRLWALLDVDPGIVWGTLIVEIRPLVGHNCASTNSCSCESVVADDLSDLYTEPSSDVLARVVIDHNRLNNSFPYLDVDFSAEPFVSNIDGRSQIVSGKYYAIVIERDYSAIDSVLSIHGNYGNNLSGLTSFVSKFDSSTGLWTDQTGDSMAYQIYSDTVEILPGDGYVDGKSISNPFVIENTSGVYVDYHLGNIDLVHTKSVTSAGAVDAGGEGRNMIIARITTTPADYQPNPRTGNPSAVSEANVIEVMVVTEKEWKLGYVARTSTTLEKSEWLLLAYATDENLKTVKGLYEPPCDINSSIISGNWSPGLIKIEDVRKFLPHAQIMKYGEHDEIPYKSASTKYNSDLFIETVDPDQALAPLYTKGFSSGPYNIFSTFCNAANELSVFDASSGVIFSTPHGGKYMYYTTDAGDLDKINIVPPMVQSVSASADPTSLPRALSASTTIGGCINSNMGLRVRLQWTPPISGHHFEFGSDGTYSVVEDKPYRGIVIVRSTEDFPRSIDDGVIIAASESGFTTSDGRTYQFNPIGQTNLCCSSSTTPGIIGDTVALRYPIPSLPLTIDNTTSGGVYNPVVGDYVYDIDPGHSFEISLRVKNTSSRVLRPVLEISLTHCIKDGSTASGEIYNAIASTPVLYDSHGYVGLTAQIPIPSSVYLDAVDGGAQLEYNLPKGLMTLDVGIYDSNADEQIGHKIIYVSNNSSSVPSMSLNNYLMTRIDKNSNETTVDAMYLSNDDLFLALSDIEILNRSTTYVDNVYMEAYALTNQKSTDGEYFSTGLVKLPIYARDAGDIDADYSLQTHAVIHGGVNAVQSGQSVSINATKDIRIDVSGVLADAFVGDSSTPSPITIFTVLRYNVAESFTAPDAPDNMVISPIELFIVDNASVINNQECTCYVDSYTGEASSLVFSGCTPELSTNPCFNGLSYNQVYYYSVFTYNDAGHFSATDRCNQVVYGMFNSIPPGPICRLSMIPEYADDGHGNTTISDIRLNWTNPSDSHLYGFRVYVSEYGHAGASCTASYANNFVETNKTPAVNDVGDVTDIDTACNMMLVYDTLLTPWITTASLGISRKPGDMCYIYDGVDNSDSASGERVLYELAPDGRSLLSQTGVTRKLKPGITYFYTVFTYDVYGNYNAPSCIDRGAVVTEI